MIGQMEVGARRLRATLGDALATRDLRAFALAAGGTSLALWAFTVIIAIVAYRDGGAPAVGLAVIARFLPAALAAPFATLLADRHSRRTALIGVALGSGAALGALAAVVAVHAPLAAVLVLAGAFAVFSTGNRPAQAALLPSLGESPRQLAAANAVWVGIDNRSFLAGSLAGGVVVVAVLSAQVALLLAAGACVLAAAALTRVHPDARPAYRPSAGGPRITRELLLGARAVAATDRLREAVGLFATLSAVDGLLDVLIVVLALRTLGLGVAGVSWLNGAWGAGGLAVA